MPVSLVRDPQELLARHGPPDDGTAMSGSLYDLGIPYPIWDSQHSPAEASARTAARQGRQVHATIARLAPLIPYTGEDDEPIEAAVSVFVAGRENGNLRRARIRVSGLVRQYLRVYLPQSATFQGSEVAARGGRADLHWSHPAVGWFYDELKTTQGHDPLTTAVLAQADRYLDAGIDWFADSFAGVRLITLGQRAGTRIVRPTGEVAPLFGSELDPANLAASTGGTSRDAGDGV